MRHWNWQPIIDIFDRLTDKKIRLEDVLYLRLEINGKLKRWTYTINWYQISLGRTILMCFARYTFIFLCRPVIIDTYTMIMDNSIIKFVRYDVIQLPGETIKDWYWHLILFCDAWASDIVLYKNEFILFRIAWILAVVQNW